jgi:hypothetical protein
MDNIVEWLGIVVGCLPKPGNGLTTFSANLAWRFACAVLSRRPDIAGGKHRPGRFDPAYNEARYLPAAADAGAAGRQECNMYDIGVRQTEVGVSLEMSA